MTSAAISYLVLAGTSCYCFSQYYRGTFKLPYGTYIIIISNSILGTCFWGKSYLLRVPEFRAKVEGLFNLTTALQDIHAFPLVATQILLNDSYDKKIAYIPVVASLLPLGMYLTNQSYSDLNFILVYVESKAVEFISASREDFYGVAAAVLFNIRDSEFEQDVDETMGLHVPILDIFNYMLCGFSYCVLIGVS